MSTGIYNACLPAHGNFTTLFTGLSAPLLMKCTSRLALIPLLLCCAPADAQIEHADGLWKLTTVAYQYYLNDPDTAISLTTQALETALSTQHRYYERSEERRVGKECRSRKRRQNATSTGR